MRLLYIFTLFLLIGLHCFAGKPNPSKWKIERAKNSIGIKAGILEQTINYTNQLNSCFRINKTAITTASEEIRMVIFKASPNEEPQGIGYSSQSGVEQSNAVKNQTDALAVKRKGNSILQQVQWIDSLSVNRETFSNLFHTTDVSITEPAKGTKQVVISFEGSSHIPGLKLELNYEIYKGFPVVRKWITLTNRGSQWIKIANLILENPEFKAQYRHSTLLTPNSRKIDPSILAFSDSAATCGLIMASEVPSKIRYLSTFGEIGYNPDYFEWVLGPRESFVSDPVALYGFSGESYATCSAVSTALDRCVEGEFHRFLNEKVLYRPLAEKNIAPVFCTWTNYSASINDTNMRQAADIASRMGFKCFQLDAGWSDTGPNGGWAVSQPKPNTQNFNDLAAMSQYLNSRNMITGLWYSDFISEKLTPVPTDTPPLFSLPLIRRDGGLALSLCYAPAREKYVREILSLHQAYKTNYFKQDLSNVCYGDLARGHESRTLKESYLRGLRGLLETQDMIHRQAPEVWLQLSHEIYWETPGPEADIAVLKHVDSYHSAPNEYWGAGNRSKLVSKNWKFKPDSLSQKLIQGALRARNLWYAHRGLPLNRVEVFGAVTTNYKGSLSPNIIDRQICSWLMGAPLSFSGDLSSLTEANIDQYHQRFAAIEKLQQKYGIYSRFQYSGVPAPTDEGWHWWGKLNDNGEGAVIVLRGTAGKESETVNIPWVASGKTYHLHGLISEKDFGTFKGSQLQKGELKLSLKNMDQEIITLKIE